jgi:hypothetical protein
MPHQALESLDRTHVCSRAPALRHVRHRPYERNRRLHAEQCCRWRGPRQSGFDDADDPRRRTGASTPRDPALTVKPMRLRSALLLVASMIAAILFAAPEAFTHPLPDSTIFLDVGRKQVVGGAASSGCTVRGRLRQAGTSHQRSALRRPAARHRTLRRRPSDRRRSGRHAVVHRSA